MPLMTQRDFQLDAWEFCRQHNMPGSVADVAKAMEFGYGLGIKDASTRLSEALEELKATRIKNNSPQ